MTSSTIRLYRGANAPPVPITFLGDIDLTGSVVEVEIVPVPGAAATVFSSAGGAAALSIDPPARVLLTYTDAFVSSLPAGRVALWQAYRVLAGARERIGAGKVWVGGDGDWMEDAGVSVEVPGVMGPPGGPGPQGEPGAAGAPGEPLLLVVSDATDIGPGGWWIARDYHAAATVTHLRAEMLLGTADGVSITVERNGVTVAGPYAVHGSAPTLVTGLALVLAAGDAVSVHRAPGGTITGPWMMLVQLDGRT
ncbi:hypothetical protein [Ancylobacter sp. IITR112]|uniref:hypothetical protein n=1 Tax=Ancylobacter sp. IITR112 TaxID=3138073 RepID=UPI00352BA4E6